MIVTPIEGETFRFHVQSLTRPDIKHLVDFEGYNGIGRCSCENFQYRLAPELDRFSRSKMPDPASDEADEYRCAHLKRAWHQVSRKIIVNIMKANKHPNSTRETEGW